MTRIYEALERSEKIAQEGRPALTGPGRQNLKLGRLSESLKETLLGLHQNITTLLPGKGGHVVQFVSALPGEGSTELCREFAKVTTLVLGRKVLLLDSNHERSAQADHFDIRPEKSVDSEDGNGSGDGKGELAPASFFRIADTSLYVTKVKGRGRPHQLMHNQGKAKDFFDSVRSTFDLVLVDSPAAAESPAGLSLSGLSDGVVLVVEAGRTRWQVADTVANRIRATGGNILGVLLNKRDYPIPQFIYERI
ncbi:chromosome partitioning protein [Desulfocurvibacter africanus]|uniref:Chromosome partitioning ATPase like protein n=1 Tax=Desulfocurvibacter africanus subsp. africanus str. Walvis Bay TaxID=690850 RepID=F3YUR1_DESAF|nr:chromosome partitioning ATPase like protein [Desulfocurvibacter africanus]EGJ49088.1 chromosome partitioning ATPase like protein [Desulfocurvibacter africanus subsp. africanus str. Walvis Bay]